MTGWRVEPVAVAAAIRAVILAAVAFGLEWTGEQVAAVMLAVETVLVLVLRSQVTSNDTLQRAGTSRQQIQDVAKSEYAQMMPVVDARVRSWDDADERREQ